MEKERARKAFALQAPMLSPWIRPAQRTGMGGGSVALFSAD